MLQEQRRALRVLNLRTRCRTAGPPTGSAQSPADRSRLVDLAIRVLAEAGATCEATCHRLLTAAQREAAEITAHAHGGALVDGSRSPAAALTAPVAPRPVTAQVPDLSEAALSDDDFGAEFFASFASDGTDPWAFMNEGELVGVGSALVRRLLGRR